MAARDPEGLLHKADTDACCDLRKTEPLERALTDPHVGRIALVYQTLDGEETGVWDQDAKDWVELDDSYRTPIKQGLKIARKQSAPDLIELPLPAATAGGQS